MNFKHGYAKNGKVEKLHKVWRKMIQRCHSLSDAAYPDYGGRGIFVCEEWRGDYVAFRTWAYSHGYNSLLTLDRVNNDEGYDPMNCRFATRKEQARNRRSTRLITFNGKTQSMAAWAEERNMTNQKLWARLNLGWPIGRALSC